MLALFAFSLGVAHINEAQLAVWMTVMGVLACLVLLLHLVMYVACPWTPTAVISAGCVLAVTQTAELAVNIVGACICAGTFDILPVYLRVTGVLVVTLNFLWFIGALFVFLCNAV